MYFFLNNEPQRLMTAFPGEKERLLMEKKKKKKSSFLQLVGTGQQFDLKWEWQRGPLGKIEPNSTGSMLNHV